MLLLTFLLYQFQQQALYNKKKLFFPPTPVLHMMSYQPHISIRPFSPRSTRFINVVTTLTLLMRPCISSHAPCLPHHPSHLSTHILAQATSVTTAAVPFVSPAPPPDKHSTPKPHTLTPHWLFLLRWLPDSCQALCFYTFNNMISFLGNHCHPCCCSSRSPTLLLPMLLFTSLVPSFSSHVQCR
jgi:hypothetical protein